MLGKIMPRFVIAGVIQNAYYANYMAVDLTKQIIANNIDTYEFNNAKKYFVSFGSCRSAISMDICPPCRDPRSLLISLK